jgi:hypothetical protein
VIDSWIGDGAPTDPALVDVWIARAERMIRNNVPDLQARLDAEADLVPPVTDLLDSVRDVVVAVVTRIFRNPEGVRTRQESTGPLGGSVTYGGNDPGGLALTADELTSLRGSSGGAFMVDMMPSTSPFSPYYVEPL